MGFIIEIMVFLIISSMIMLFVAPTKEVMIWRNNISRDTKQVIVDSDTQKAINNQIDDPVVLEENEEINEEQIQEQGNKVKIIYNGLDQEASEKEYSYNDKRYSVSYTKKIAKDSRWVGNISNFNYKVNNKMKIDRMIEEYFENMLERNKEINIPQYMKTFKERNLESNSENDNERKYNDKNKIMIIENIENQDNESHIEILYIEYVEIKDIQKEYGRYVIKYDIIKGEIKVDNNKIKSDEEILNGIDYDVENDTDNYIKKNRLIIET